MLLRNVCSASRRGDTDRSLARSAWESVPRKNRPVGYGMIGNEGRPGRLSDCAALYTYSCRVTIMLCPLGQKPVAALPAAALKMANRQVVSAVCAERLDYYERCFRGLATAFLVLARHWERLSAFPFAIRK